MAVSNDAKKYSRYDYFLAALRYSIKQRKRGIKTKLAKTAGFTPTYLTMVLKEERQMQDELQKNVASFFGFEHEDFISFGNTIKTGAVICDDIFNKTEPHSHARATFIVKRAINEIGFGNIPIFTYEALLSTGALPAINEYINKDLDDRQLLEETKKKLEEFKTIMCEQTQ